jgi:DNA-binding transcriptional LysR family regulator
MKEQIGLNGLTGILAFARAASLGSFSAAARALAVSPSAVSKSVQRLEESLGVNLFSRTTRSLTLTPEGQELLKRAINLLREVDALEQSAVAVRDLPEGNVKVTAPLPIGIHILAPALPRFRALYPAITVDLRLGDQFSDLIREGIDVALRVGTLPDTRIISKPLAPHRVAAFAAPAYLAHRGMPTHPNQLGGHDLVNFRYQSSGQVLRWPFMDNGELLEIEPQAGLVMDASDAVAAALAAGAGIGISPTYVAAPYVSRGLLTPVLPDFAVDRSTIVALWPESRRSNPCVKAFIGFLDDLFRAPTIWDTVAGSRAGSTRLV